MKPETTASRVKLVGVAAAVATAAAIGAAVVPGAASAGTVGDYAQPESGAVSITSGGSEINVMVVNRLLADSCTVTATRKDGAGTKTLTRTVKLTNGNQHTSIASFRGVLDKTSYTVSGTCVGPKTATDNDPTADQADETTNETSTTNLLGGSNSAVVRVDYSTTPRYGECLQVVKGVSWDLGLRGSTLQFVLGIAAQFCPR